MNRSSHKTPLKALISGLFGILLFLIVLVVLRFIAAHTSWPLFDGFVDLLFANAPLIIFFSILFTIGEMFAAFSFPFNLPFPVFNAVASVLLVSFLMSLLQFINAYYTLGIGDALDVVKLFLLPLTLIIVLVAGYLAIFVKLKGPETTPPSSAQEKAEERQVCPTWETIGEEFRHMVADLIRKIRNEINKD
ncbi:MAG TPA: hypothetical protein PK069_10005 [Methanolinea sp.]|nr:hypothetical protein [Methanolinea sp.]HQK56820.1 hypothetical protein [Methanolinea sp.]